jgi:elongator complex protein 4
VGSISIQARALSDLDHRNDANNTLNRALRISILIPPLLNLDSTHGQRDILRFMNSLRSLLRGSSATALITLPPHNSSSPAYASFISALTHLSDAAITLVSDSLNPLSSHHGILQLDKLPCYRSLVSPSDKLSTLRGLGTRSRGDPNNRGGGENNIAFRCKRRALIIETLHLDVEGGVGERRTAPPPAVLLPPRPAPSEAHEKRSLVELHPMPKGAESALIRAPEVRSSAKGGRPRRKVAFTDPGAIYDF